MYALTYYLSLPVLLFFSILPFRVLYLLSDILFPVVYYLLPYRKKVVMENLRNALHERTEKERHRLARKF